VPDSSEATERETTSAEPTPRERSPRTSAGTPREPSSKDLPTREEDALSGEPLESNGSDVSHHGDSESRDNSDSKEPRLSEDS
jgi:hypothetical protein